MGVWLSQGTDAIRSQTRAFLEAAGDQTRFAGVAGEVDNAMRDARVPIERLGRALLVGLGPALVQVANRLGPLVARIAPRFEAWVARIAATIERWVSGGGLDRLADGIASAAVWIERFATAIGPVGVAVVATLPLWAPLAAGLVSLGVSAGGAVVALGPVGVSLIAIGAAAVSVGANLRALDAEVADIWNSIKWTFSDGLAWIEHVVEKAGGLMGIFGNPLGALGTVVRERGWTTRADGGAGGEGTNALGGLLQRTVGAPVGTALETVSTGASLARKGMIGAQQTAKVVVDFVHAPTGTRVTEATGSTADVDWSLGWTMDGGAR
jgi:hypothetical protein